MNLLKPVIRGLMVTCVTFTLPLLGHAASATVSDSVILPTLIVMAEPELRAVIEVVPYQEDASQRQALQMRMMEIERDIQSYSVDADFVANIDVMRAPATPDLDSLPVIFQEYVLAVAQGLLSSDPRNGIYVVLQPFGINRDATTVQIAREQFNSYRNQPNLSLPFPSR
ncbi:MULTISPECIES: hypothetical protein [unclassified Acinetobacter]|uniref:hypothetical protein n=1 Tax=unclassified Acinetobacter TaxID=196816 RepID=UPI001C23F7A3|nr:MULTISPECIES: hypothetical protein [unclassified Acinetobacter]